MKREEIRTREDFYFWCGLNADNIPYRTDQGSVFLSDLPVEEQRRVITEWADRQHLPDSIPLRALLQLLEAVDLIEKRVSELERRHQEDGK